MSNSSVPETEGQYVDLSINAIFRRIKKRWKWLLATSLVTAALFTVYAFLATPVYQSTILIAPASSGGAMSGGGLASLAQSFGGGFFGGGNSGAGRNSRAISLSSLTSPFFIRAFIEENDLLPILFEGDWDVEAEEWRIDNPPTLSDAYDLFEKKVLLVEEDKFTNLVNVTVSWKDPMLAAEWANQLVARVNSRLRQQAIGDADLTITYLNEELAKTQAVELQQSIYFMIQNEIQKKTLANVQGEYAYRVLSPAIPSDADKYASPNRPFIISVGIAVGIFIGLLLIFIAGSIIDMRADNSASQS